MEERGFKIGDYVHASEQKVYSKLCSTLSGHILRWIDSNTFIALITNRNGQRGEMICHTDYWEVRNV